MASAPQLPGVAEIGGLVNAYLPVDHYVERSWTALNNRSYAARIQASALAGMVGHYTHATEQGPR